MYNSKSIIYVFLLISFLFWVYISNLLLSFSLSILSIILLWIFFLNFYLYKKIFLYIFVSILIWASLGILYSYFYNNTISFNKNLIHTYQDSFKYKLRLEILSLYSKSEYTNKYNIKLLKINEENLDKYKINWLLSIPANLKIEDLSIIELDSKIYWIDNFSNFDYKNYLLSKSIYFELKSNTFSVLEIKDKNKILSFINGFKEQFIDIIYKLYTKEEAVFLSWLLLWAKEDMSSELKKDFNNSWLSHFIAVSWFNISILIIFFSYLFSYFPIFLRVFFISLFISIFVILVWDTAPVIRASIMGLLWYYVLMSGRKINILLILLSSIFLMTIINPLILNYDISFQLSFLAVLGIIYTKNFFDRFFCFLPNFLAIKDSFSITVSAMTFTLAIMIFDFWQISLFSVIANVLVAFTIPITMLLGFLSIIFFYIYDILWFVFWYFTWIFLRYDLFIVKLFWNLDFAIIKMDFSKYWELFKIIYIIILWFIIIIFHKKER